MMIVLSIHFTVLTVFICVLNIHKKNRLLVFTVIFTITNEKHFKYSFSQNLNSGSCVAYNLNIIYIK